MPQEGAGSGPAVPPLPAAQIPPQGQQLVVNAQYVKDLSFENPRAPHSLGQQQTQPSLDINVDVKAQGLGPDMFEVILTLKVNAKVQENPLFVLELIYGAVITARNMPQEMLSSIVLVETPRLMFPFVRNIIADTTRDGGFPPLMIQPIDFAEVARRNAAQAAAAGPAATGSA